MSRRVWAEINLKALQNNLKLARSFLPLSKTLAVIKADAYGHGIDQCAQALSEADAFGVAHVGEAMHLCSAGIVKPILLMEGVLDDDEMELAARQGFWVAVGNAQQLKYVSTCKPEKPLNLWLKVNTGMNRLGVSVERAKEMYKELKAMTHVAEVVFMTHFACADDLESTATETQIKQFKNLVEGLDAQSSLANSAGIIAWNQQLRFSSQQWIRPGIMLYGSSSLKPGYDSQGAEKQSAAEQKLQPVMTLLSKLMEIKTLEAGESVGYGATWTADKTTRIGVISIGYGDGYPRHAKNGTPVLLNGKRVPLVGRVSMDMITVDLSTQPDAKIGDLATLWGRGLSVEEVASCADTISYELFCKVTPRVPRDYLNQGISSS